MTSPQQRKGDRFERAVVAYCREEGLTIVRQHDGGTLDVGDLVLGPFVLDAKAYKDTVTALRMGLAKAEKATLTPGYTHLVPAVVADRPGYGIGSSYVAFALKDMSKLMLKLRGF